MRGPTVNLTDRQIAARAGAGDVAAYVQLVERYRAPLIGYLFAMTGRREEAEELAQDAFCKVWQELPTLQRRDSMVSWLYRIAHNLAISASRRPRVAILTHDVASAQVKSADEMLEVHRAVADLPEPWRVIVSLRHFSGLSHEEIADVLSIPAGTVRSRLSRAYARLRVALAALVES
jgi:RNA polymerase sigma-70 factor (ECF subfamily)